MSMLCPRSMIVKPWDTLSTSHVSLSKNLCFKRKLKLLEDCAAYQIKHTNTKYLPFTKGKVVGFNITMNYSTLVKLFYHMENFYGEIDDKSLGHHFLSQFFVYVYGILR